MTAAVAGQFKSSTLHKKTDDLCPAESRGRVAVCNVLLVCHCPTCSPPVKGAEAKKRRSARAPLTAPAVTKVFLLVPLPGAVTFAEETVTLILNACGEEELIGVSCHKAICRRSSPKGRQWRWIALTTAKLTVERVGPELEASDATVAEIAHEQVAENFPKLSGASARPKAS